MGTILVSAAACIMMLGAEPEQSYYKTKAEAVQHVPLHVEPKDCFVWKDGPAASPWRVIPGTGCAHWVAHQKGIHRGKTCSDGYSLRVKDVVQGQKQHGLIDAKLGDIWTTKSLSHCGIVVGVNKDSAGKVTSLKVRNCSSGRGGVVTSNCKSGFVYRGS